MMVLWRELDNILLIVFFSWFTNDKHPCLNKVLADEVVKRKKATYKTRNFCHMK